MAVIAEMDQGLGVDDGEVLEQDRVDEGKDGGIGADAEREGEDDGEGEAGSFAELAQGVTEVLNDSLEAEADDFVAALF